MAAHERKTSDAAASGSNYFCLLLICVFALLTASLASVFSSRALWQEKAPIIRASSVRRSYQEDKSLSLNVPRLARLGRIKLPELRAADTVSVVSGPRPGARFLLGSAISPSPMTWRTIKPLCGHLVIPVFFSTPSLQTHLAEKLLFAKHNKGER